MGTQHISYQFKASAVALAAVLLASHGPALASDDPDVISIGVIPFEEIQLTAQKFQGVVNAIKAATGKQVEWHFPTSYASLIEAQRRGFIHIGYYGPESYVRANAASDGNVKAFAQAVWGTGPYRDPKAGYNSYLIVKADSPYETVEELRGKTLALVSSASTSGNLLPKVGLGEELGERLDDFFGSTFYAGSHTAAQLAVLEGNAEAATVADVTLDWSVDAGHFDGETFKVLWRSALLPLDPFAWREDMLSEELRDQILTALLEMENTPEGQEFLRQTRSDRVERVEDGAYDGVRAVMERYPEWE